MVVGRHLLKSWSTTQPTITLSSGEAELHGVVRGAATGLGFLSLLADFGIIILMRIWTDSTASQGICARQGLGKIRHLDVQELWVQQRLGRGDFSLYKIDGDSNPGDIFTKGSLTHHRIKTLLELLGCRYVEGRALAAPALRTIPGKERSLHVKGEKKKWSQDGEEDFDKVMSEEEVVNFLKRKGLPHSHHCDYKAEAPKEEYPEQPAEEDYLFAEGEQIAKFQKGRGGLPSRLRSVDGPSPRGRVEDRTASTTGT